MSGNQRATQAEIIHIAVGASGPNPPKPLADRSQPARLARPRAARAGRKMVGPARLINEL